jgi:4-amino-4-deoxy-L-arabinose transferase-like glycosyltransferase
MVLMRSFIAMPRRSVWVFGLFLLYAIVRVALLPSEPSVAAGFGHDSAYLAMVADNIMSGKGLVLDALWLVYLQPVQLPLPYHNANPLFPVLNAAFSSIFQTDVIRTSFILAALASVLLWAALTWLLRYFLPNKPNLALAAAFAAILFPEPWASSWNALTDEVWCALMVAFLAAFVRSERKGMAALAGALWGLAWLTRSLATLVIPAVLVWALMVYGFRKAVSRTALMAVVALLVCAPWLIHTTKTWGSPLRSDSGYMLSTHAYYAWTFNPFSHVRAWHSPTPPLSFGELIRKYPREVAMRWVKNLVPAARIMVSGSVGRSIPCLALLLIVTLLVGFRERRAFLSVEGAACLVYFLTFFGALSISGPFMEPRYFILGYVLFASWLFSRLLQLGASVASGNREPPAMAAVAVAVCYGVFFLLPIDYEVARRGRCPDLVENVPYQRAARMFNERIIHGKPVIVGDHPYLYSIYTGGQALSIPESDDKYLVRYMRKYGARHILLSEEERAFWRPGWADSLPEDIELVDQADGYFLYELGDGRRT